MLLINVHKDNFGDSLNALAGEEFCRERLGAEPSAAIHVPSPWKSEVVLANGIHAQNPLSAAQISEEDAAVHALGVDHPCPHREAWSLLDGLISSHETVLSVPSGAGLGPHRSVPMLAELLVASRAGAVVGMLSGTVHPSGNALFDGLTRAVLGSVLVAPRDAATHEVLRAWGREVGPPVDASLLTARRLAAGATERRRPAVTVVLGDTLAWHPRALEIEGRDVGGLPRSPFCGESGRVPVVETLTSSLFRTHRLMPRWTACTPSLPVV